MEKGRGRAHCPSISSRAVEALGDISIIKKEKKGYRCLQPPYIYQDIFLKLTRQFHVEQTKTILLSFMWNRLKLTANNPH